MSNQDISILQAEGLKIAIGRLSEALGREPTAEEKLIAKMGFKAGVETQADIDQLKISNLEMGLANAQKIAVLS